MLQPARCHYTPGNPPAVADVTRAGTHCATAAGPLCLYDKEGPPNEPVKYAFNNEAAVNAFNNEAAVNAFNNEAAVNAQLWLFLC